MRFHLVSRYFLVTQLEHYYWENNKIIFTTFGEQLFEGGFIRSVFTNLKVGKQGNYTLKSYVKIQNDIPKDPFAKGIIRHIKIQIIK